MINLDRKIRLEDMKEFKIERKVFDDRTLFSIYKLMKKGIIKSLQSTIKEGKESLVVSAKNSTGKWIAVKIYRIEHCDFKSMWNYLIEDPRFFGIKKRRRSVVLNWCKREFKNLTIAYDAGVSCPKPIAFNENVLVMEFIGSKGIPAPSLINIRMEKEEGKIVYEMIIKEIKKLYRAGLVHGDLSAWNVLFHKGKIFLFDLSQAVPINHPLANQMLRRDVKNINMYFKKIGIEKDEENVIKEVVGVSIDRFYKNT